jgi:nucleotide-binding universal stress UspA family protein
MATKILCGIDGRDSSVSAADVAAELAKKLNAQLMLYMVNPALPGRAARFYLWSDEFLQATLHKMKRLATGSGVPDVRCESRRAADVAEAIVDHADLHDVDYIVVGASGRPAFLKVLIGSVSREVVAKATCPVIVVRRTRAKPGRDIYRGPPEPVDNSDEIAAVA